MIKFGHIEIDISTRAVRRRDEVLHVGSRAFEILALLASVDGRLVTKDELMDAVRPVSAARFELGIACSQPEMRRWPRTRSSGQVRYWRCQRWHIRRVGLAGSVGVDRA